MSWHYYVDPGGNVHRRDEALSGVLLDQLDWTEVHVLTALGVGWAKVEEPVDREVVRYSQRLRKKPRNTLVRSLVPGCENTYFVKTGSTNDTWECANAEGERIQIGGTAAQPSFRSEQIWLPVVVVS